MATTYTPNNNGHPVKHLRPAVHNLIFVERRLSDDELQGVLDECPYAVKVYTYPDSRQWQSIPARDILELRIICDSTFCEPQFISQQESDLKIGRMVAVVHGPLKGISGKLVRKNKKYYVVKSFVGLGVMVAVSRWCCREVESGE